MKRIFLFFLTLFLGSISLFSQKFPLSELFKNNENKKVKLLKINNFKSQAFSKICLDSIVISNQQIRFGKNYFEYNKNGQVILKKDYSYLIFSAGFYEYIENIEREYDSLYRLKSVLSYRVIQDTTNLLNYDTLYVYKFLYEYPQNASPTFREYYYYFDSDSNQYYLSYINEYYYSGDLIDSIRFINPDYIPFYLTVYVYNEQNLIDTIKYYNYDSFGSPILYSFEVYTYLNGNIDEYKFYYLNNDEFLLSNYHKYYYSEGKLDSVKYFTNYSNELLLYSKEVYSYQGDTVELLNYQYDYSNNPSQIIYINKKVWVLNQNNDLVVEENYNYDFNNDLWIKLMKIEIEYTNYLTNDIFTSEDLSSMNYAPSKAYFYMSDENNQWLFFAEYNFYYNLHEFLSLKNVNNLVLRVYPNPVTDFLYLEGDNIENVEIYDVTGKPIIYQKYFSKPIDVRNLQNGVYKIVIRDNFGIRTSIFIKK